MSGSGSRKKIRSGYSIHNTAQLLRSGGEFFNTLEKLIDGAQNEIHFQTYIFAEDETGEQIQRALIRAAGRGVKIYLLADAYGSGNLSEKFLQEIKKAGIEFRWFGPLFRRGKFHIGRRLHRKVVVADRRISLVSGINISNHYNDLSGNDPWLDFGVLVSGEISIRLHLICRQSWLKIRFRKKAERTGAGPLNEPDRNILPVKIRVRQNDRKIGKNQAAISYYQMIRQSVESLVIVGGYFLPSRKARRLLRKASERGVNIHLVIAERSDVGLMRTALLYLYDWLLRTKIHIYEYQPSNVHGKVIVADRKKVSIGSYDMNTLSTYSNIELNLDVDDAAFAAGIHESLSRIMLNDCVEVNPDTFRIRSGISARLVRWFAYRIVKSLFVLSIWLAKEEKGEAYH